MDAMKLKIISFLFISFALSAISAQTWRIGRVRYAIDGRTTEQALARMLGIDTERIFVSQEELASYVEQLRQQLAGCRTFDTASVGEALSAPDQNGVVIDSLAIAVRDTKNIIIVPYPSYSSNTGVAAKLKLKDYDFAGTLSPLSASLYYAPDEDTFDLTADSLIGGDVTLAVPFTLLGRNACITAGADAAYALNRNEMLFGSNLQAEYYPVAAGCLAWGPYMSADIRRSDAYSAGGYESSAGVGQKFTVQDVVWNGNFRNGCSVSAVQTFDYDFIDRKPFIAFSADATEFRSSERIGIAAHEHLMYRTNGEYERNAGSYIRGVRDRDVRSDMLFACNADMPFTACIVRFPDDSKLSLFDFELQCSPFIDIMLGHNADAGSYFDLKDGWYAFGLDVNVFPAHWRSVQVHGSFGIDAVKLLQRMNSSAADSAFTMSWRNGPLFEISAGIGLFY